MDDEEEGGDDDVDGSSSPPSSSSSSRRSPRGKVNEIDFCMAPSDVSLSRSVSSTSTAATTWAPAFNVAPSSSSSKKALSLTRALNSASNRAVRRILLSRSWPSAEALNVSLRRVLASGGGSGDGGGDVVASGAETTTTGGMDDASTSTSASIATASGDGSVVDGVGSKCPVPRPILNIIMSRRSEDADGTASVVGGGDVDDVDGGGNNKDDDNLPIPRSKRGRSEEEWVSDQMEAFRSR